MFATILSALFIGFLAYASSHYTLSQFVKNSLAVVVSCAIFAVLIVIFASKLAL